MATTVFYAWQSDRDGKVCHFLIRDAATDAIQRLKDGGTKTDAEVEDAPAIGDEVELDHDTKGVPGTPVIAETIKRKIAACAVFIADVTHVGKIDADGNRTKKSQNGNVLIELGQAIARKSCEQILLVMNTAFGEWDELPFDLRHSWKPILYNLPDAKDKGRLKVVQQQLTDKLVEALGLMLVKLADERDQQRSVTAEQIHQGRELYAKVVRNGFDSQVDLGQFTPLMPDRSILTITLVPPIQKPQIDIGEIDPDRRAAFKSLFVSGWDHRYFDDRFAMFAPVRQDAQGKDMSSSTTALYIDGHVLSAAVVPESLITTGKYPVLKFRMIERAAIMLVTEFIRGLRAIGVTGPFWLGMSLLRTNNLTLLDERSDSGRPITERGIAPPLVSLPADLDSNPATAKAMKPLLDRFWRAAGYPRDPFFDSDSNWSQNTW